MPLITVKSGAPSDIAPGAYTVTLTAIDGPRTIVPQSGQNAGQEIEILDWTFVTDDDQEIQGTTSLASGPKSKLYNWLTALLGGVAPAAGSQFEADQLVGRMAIATVEVNDGGWPRIASMSAIPVKRAPAAPAAAPATPRPRPVPAPVAPAPVAEQDLPF